LIEHVKEVTCAWYKFSIKDTTLAEFNPPTIETSRFYLRPFSDADLEGYARLIFANPNVTRYLPKRDIPPKDRATRTIRYVSEHWLKYGYGLWAVVPKISGELIGHCGLNYLVDTQEVEVDYALAEAYWGQGIATEVAYASLQFGFENIGIERIIALAVPENIASRKVMEHIGMVYVKQAHYFGLDLVYYEIWQEKFREQADT